MGVDRRSSHCERAGLGLVGARAQKRVVDLAVHRRNRKIPLAAPERYTSSLEMFADATRPRALGGSLAGDNDEAQTLGCPGMQRNID